MTPILAQELLLCEVVAEYRRSQLCRIVARQQIKRQVDGLSRENSHAGEFGVQSGTAPLHVWERSSSWLAAHVGQAAAHLLHVASFSAR